MYTFPTYFGFFYISPLLSQNLCTFFPVFVFLASPILTMMHLCIMLYTYWTPLLESMNVLRDRVSSSTIKVLPKSTIESPSNPNHRRKKTFLLFYYFYKKNAFLTFLLFER